VIAEAKVAKPTIKALSGKLRLNVLKATEELTISTPVKSDILPFWLGGQPTLPVTKEGKKAPSKISEEEKEDLSNSPDSDLGDTNI